MITEHLDNWLKTKVKSLVPDLVAYDELLMKMVDKTDTIDIMLDGEDSWYTAQYIYDLGIATKIN